MGDVIKCGGEKLTAGQYFSKTYDHLFRFGEKTESFVCYPNVRDLNFKKISYDFFEENNRKHYYIEYKVDFQDCQYLASKLEYSKCTCIKRIDEIKNKNTIEVSVWREDELFVPDCFLDFVSRVIKAKFRYRFIKT